MRPVCSLALWLPSIGFKTKRLVKLYDYDCSSLPKIKETVLKKRRHSQQARADRDRVNNLRRKVSALRFNPLFLGDPDAIGLFHGSWPAMHSSFSNAVSDELSSQVHIPVSTVYTFFLFAYHGIRFNEEHVIVSGSTVGKKDFL